MGMPIVPLTPNRNTDPTCPIQVEALPHPASSLHPSKASSPSESSPPATPSSPVAPLHHVEPTVAGKHANVQGADCHLDIKRHISSREPIIRPRVHHVNRQTTMRQVPTCTHPTVSPLPIALHKGPCTRRGRETEEPWQPMVLPWAQDPPCPLNR